jgi:phospholipid/cholesterol/gamma-HCH transport system ATP-binding protein
MANVKSNIQPLITDTSENVIQVRDLHKAFGDNQVINGFNFNLKRGENVVVLGKSGSGKSVLIKCIIGLMQPDQGSIQCIGQ